MIPKRDKKNKKQKKGSAPLSNHTHRQLLQRGAKHYSTQRRAKMKKEKNEMKMRMKRHHQIERSRENARVVRPCAPSDNKSHRGWV
jgi:hypothetical protein